MPAVIDGPVSPTRAHVRALTAQFGTSGLPSLSQKASLNTKFSIVSSKHLRILRVFTAMTSLLPASPHHITPRVGAVALPNCAKALPGRQSKA
jgi:hypothetical protein